MASSPTQRPAVEGADRDRMLVLDLFALQHATGHYVHFEHPATKLLGAEFMAARDALEADGLLEPRGPIMIAISEKGLAAHAAARRADAPAPRG